MKDSFFSFNDFEHCQDSFLGWLFNDYSKNSDLARRIATRLISVFTRMRVDCSEVEVKKLKAIPQPSKGVIADLLISFECQGKPYAVFVEDKTKSDHSALQVKKMVSSMSTYKLGNFFDAKEEDRYYVFFSTNPRQEEIKNKVPECVYLLREDILKIFKEEFEKTPNGVSCEWILDSYFAYLKGNCLPLRLSDMSDFVFKNYIEDLFDKLFVSINFNSDSAMKYSHDTRYTLETIISPKDKRSDFELVIHTKKESKCCLTMRIVLQTPVKNEARESKVAKAFGVDSKFRKSPGANYRNLNISKYFNTVDELSVKLRSIFDAILILMKTK